MSVLFAGEGGQEVGLALVPQLPARNGGSCVLHGDFESLLFRQCVDKCFFLEAALEEATATKTHGHKEPRTPPRKLHVRMIAVV